MNGFAPILRPSQGPVLTITLHLPYLAEDTGFEPARELPLDCFQDSLLPVAYLPYLAESSVLETQGKEPHTS